MAPKTIDIIAILQNNSLTFLHHRSFPKESIIFVALWIYLLIYFIPHEVVNLANMFSSAVLVWL